MEEQADYITEAMDLLNGDQPAAIIDPPRNVRALREDGLVDYKTWGWVKTSAKFRNHIKILRGAKHDIWHYLALGVDETGRCKETIKQICAGTGYSHTEVINTLRELDKMGYLSIEKGAKGSIYTPEFVARGENKPTENAVKKVESTPVYQVESTPPIEKSPSIPLRVKRVKELPLEEIEKQADRKVDAILGFAKLQGKWKGRENIPPHLLGYADWWNEKTGQEFPGKVKNDYLKEWTQWHSDQITRPALDAAFEYEDGWRRKQGGKVSHPRELTKSAFGFNANPKTENTGTTYTDDEGIPLS